MREPIDFFRCVTRAAVTEACFGPDGAFDVEGLPGVARAVWTDWGRQSNREELRAEVEALAGVLEDEAKRLAALAVRAEADRQPAPMQDALTEYLSSVPGCIRRTQRRPPDPQGHTAPATVVPGRAEDVLPWLPARLPRLRRGQRAPGFPDWELDELLGVGGFGEVWKASHAHLPAVALKFCLDPAVADSLRNEAALLGRVARQGRHPGIVALLDTALSAEPPCLKYEYVAGGDLTGLIHAWHAGACPDLGGRSLALLRQVAEVIAFAHALEPPIVHRDLKPANILVARGASIPACQEEEGKQGCLPYEVKVTDFGIAAIVARQLDAVGQNSTRGRFLPAALRGSCTPLYASPQQLRGEEPDPRDDVFALGVLWFQLLTGQLTERPGTDWRDHLGERDMPEPVLRLLGECLASRANTRPANAGVLLERLRSLAGPAPEGDPARVQIVEAAVPPLCVAVSPVRAEHVQVPGLPELPPELLELEVRLAGIDQTIAELERERHPALKPAIDATDAARRQLEQLNQDLARHPLPLDEQKKRQLEAAVARNLRGRLLPLCDLAPECDPEELLPYIYRLRNVERARVVLADARQQYDARRQEQIAALRVERQELERGLGGLRQEDLRRVLLAFFEGEANEDEFPLEAWTRLAPALKARCRGRSSRELLALAEDAYDTWRQKRILDRMPRKIVNALGMQFALVPAGRFRMGSPEGERGREAAEGPRREVTISQPFYLGVFPVTQAQYLRVTGSNPSHFKAVAGCETASFPVENLSWQDAVGFCEQLAAIPEERAAGRVYRLPTEAEWEYACREAGAADGPFSCGESFGSHLGNFDATHPYGDVSPGPTHGRPTPVGSYPPNALGLYDMHGNVWEWVRDWYDAGYYRTGPAVDPRGPDRGDEHVLRGGSWSNHGDRCRSAARGRDRSGTSWGKAYGFRVVLLLHGSAAW